MLRLRSSAHDDPSGTRSRGYRGRFAPSPTGPLHAGSLLAALGSWLHARVAGGEWLVRIEDLDPPREVAGASQQQLDALAGFGLIADQPPLRQSERGEAYTLALDRLLDQGDAFVCHCSRSDLQATGGVHRQCVPGARRRDPAIRLRVTDDSIISFEDGAHGLVTQDVSIDIGDIVLRRADGLWAYQLAAVVDDAAQHITDVVRGADLIDSTPRQILLQQRLGLPTPRYLHLPLLIDDRGNKLSKSLAALPVDATDPLPTLCALWRVLGQDAARLFKAADVAAWLDSAVATFDPRAIPSTPAARLAASHNAIAAPRE